MCSAEGEVFDGSPLYVTITRTAMPMEQERMEVLVEGNRIQTAKMMKEARAIADEKELANARQILTEADSLLDGVVVDEPNQALIEMLKYELQHLLSLMQSEKMYKEQGHPFALSSETSHDRQRHAARGDMEKLRLFTTPRMNMYLEQAKTFNKDPTQPLPGVDADRQQEIDADPFGPTIRSLSYHIQTAAQSLQDIDKSLKAVEKILNASRT